MNRDALIGVGDVPFDPPPRTHPPVFPLVAGLPNRQSTPSVDTPPLDRAPVIQLRFDHGLVVEVTGIGRVGREPVPPAGAQTALLVKIHDPNHSVSKTHLQFGPTNRGIWVEDLGSTNGTDLLVNGRLRRLVPGERVEALIGAHVRFGLHSFVVGRS